MRRGYDSGARQRCVTVVRDIDTRVQQYTPYRGLQGWLRD